MEQLDTQEKLVEVEKEEEEEEEEEEEDELAFALDDLEITKKFLLRRYCEEEKVIVHGTKKRDYIDAIIAYNAAVVSDEDEQVFEYKKDGVKAEEQAENAAEQKDEEKEELIEEQEQEQEKEEQQQEELEEEDLEVKGKKEEEKHEEEQQHVQKKDEENAKHIAQLEELNNNQEQEDLKMKQDECEAEEEESGKEHLEMEVEEHQQKEEKNDPVDNKVEYQEHQETLENKQEQEQEFKFSTEMQEQVESPAPATKIHNNSESKEEISTASWSEKDSLLLASLSSSLVEGDGFSSAPLEATVTKPEEEESTLKTLDTSFSRRSSVTMSSSAFFPLSAVTPKKIISTTIQNNIHEISAVQIVEPDDQLDAHNENENNKQDNKLKKLSPIKKTPELNRLLSCTENPDLESKPLYLEEEEKVEQEEEEKKERREERK